MTAGLVLDAAVTRGPASDFDRPRSSDCDRSGHFRYLILAHSMAAPAATSADRIGDLLVREGMISREQLKRALQEQKQSGTRLGYNLVKLGFIPEVELTKVLAKQFKMPAVDLSRFEVDPKIAKM